jgi:hypothetical protein
VQERVPLRSEGESDVELGREVAREVDPDPPDLQDEAEAENERESQLILATPRKGKGRRDDCCLRHRPNDRKADGCPPPHGLDTERHQDGSAEGDVRPGPTFRENLYIRSTFQIVWLLLALGLVLVVAPDLRRAALSPCAVPLTSLSFLCQKRDRVRNAFYEFVVWDELKGAAGSCRRVALRFHPLFSEPEVWARALARSGQYRGELLAYLSLPPVLERRLTGWSCPALGSVLTTGYSQCPRADARRMSGLSRRRTVDARSTASLGAERTRSSIRASRHLQQRLPDEGRVDDVVRGGDAKLSRCSGLSIGASRLAA